METCVLIPKEFSLVLTTDPSYKLFKNAPLSEMRISVWSNVFIPSGTLIYPFQGSIRFDKIDLYSLLDDNDIRREYGCYDEVSFSSYNLNYRQCNWIRFLHIVQTYNDQVNLIGTKVRGEPIFEVIKDVQPDTELAACFVPVDDDDLVLISHAQWTRTAIYRYTIDSILDGKALLVATTRIGHRELAISVLNAVLCSKKHVVKPEAGKLDLNLDEFPYTAKSDISKNLPRSIDPDKSPLDLSMALLSHQSSSVPSCYEADEYESTSGESSTSTLSLVGDHLECSILTTMKRGERVLLPCEVCGKSFDRPSLLKRHMRTHTGEKPHVCMVCNKGFSTSSSLNTHKRIHSGEKPHQCLVCGKKFTASSNLYYHRMTHIKEKPHKCSQCSKSFPTPGDLKSHTYVHNGLWPFRCHICNRGFSKPTNLKNHMLLHLGRCSNKKFVKSDL